MVHKRAASPALLCLYLLLVGVLCKSIDPKQKTPTFASATRSENGVVYEYSNDNGRERLKVQGPIDASFDSERVMREFREALGLTKGGFSCSNPANPPDETHKQHDKSLLESFSEFFVGTKFISNVQKYYDSFTNTEQKEQLELAKRELFSIDDDLSKVHTQELILRSRQSELGAWLRENVRKAVEERNPTVEELVNAESDRLALLEHRLQRLKKKLASQKSEVTNYIAMQERVTTRDFYEKVDEETHVFTRNGGCGAVPSPAIITDEDEREFVNILPYADESS